MATYNPNLENLSLDEIIGVSEKFLMGWHDLLGCGYGFRVKGLNRKRSEYGLEPLTKELSAEYRVNYIRSNFTLDEICNTIEEFLLHSRVGEERWSGIELFGCRFGREYAKIFRELVGSAEYRRIGENARVKKLKETQIDLYGGIGVAGNITMEKARATVQERYGTDNVMKSELVKQTLAEKNMEKYGGISPFCNENVRCKAQDSKWKNMQERANALAEIGILNTMSVKLLKSRCESYAFLLLVEKFGRKDVLYEYGIHPSDPRYPHNCDFYIKSLDLFIEMNTHYCHGSHWFDESNVNDVNRLRQLSSSSSKRAREAALTWSDVDLKKRQDAVRSGIKYLVFWDGSTKTGTDIPNLCDFKIWFYDYGCDYDLFVKDHPENTY